jgi:hypothetical protein
MMLLCAVFCLFSYFAFHGCHGSMDFLRGVIPSSPQVGVFDLKRRIPVRSYILFKFLSALGIRFCVIELLS